MSFLKLDELILHWDTRSAFSMGGDPNIDITLIFAFGTAGMLFMAGAVVLFVFFYQKKMLEEQVKLQNLEAEYQQKMLSAALESQENERIRVAKDLHDDVGMMLMTMRTYINSVSENNLPELIVPEIRALVDDTHETIRRLSWDLMPSTLERFGLIQTLREMCHRLTQRNAIPVEFREPDTQLNLDKTQETLLYRIVQESVTNALRHSHATKISISLTLSNPFLYLSISDDGLGFDFPVDNNKIKMRLGLGLLNIESRAKLLGASLEYQNNVPSGVVINLKLKVGA